MTATDAASVARTAPSVASKRLVRPRAPGSRGPCATPSRSASGFRPHGSIVAIFGACLLILAFSFSLSWIMANIGMKAANAEAAQAVAFPLMFPLTFASAAFVPVNSMPGWLQVFPAHQPVTVVINATRDLMLGPEVSSNLRAAGVFTASSTSYVLQSLAWIAVILAVFVPLAIRQFNRS